MNINQHIHLIGCKLVDYVGLKWIIIKVHFLNYWQYPLQIINTSLVPAPNKEQTPSNAYIYTLIVVGTNHSDMSNLFSLLLYNIM